MAIKAASTRWLLGAIVIGAAVIAIATAQLGDNVVYFYTPDEAVAKAAELSKKNIRVGGMVVPGTVDWQAQNLSLAFTVSDLKGHEIRVTHNGTPPDMFKENQGVVVEGYLAADGKTMTAKTLMVKHSEEYKSTGDHATMEKSLLEKSMFRDQKPAVGQ